MSEIKNAFITALTVTAAITGAGMALTGGSSSAVSAAQEQARENGQKQTMRVARPHYNKKQNGWEEV